MNIPLGFSADNKIAADYLAIEYGFAINNEVLPRLNLTSERLELLIKGFSPLFVDFSSKSLQRRRQQSKNQGLVKACKPEEGVTILDLTAGWGRDSALLASLGAKVLMLERKEVMAALLDDGIKRIDENFFVKGSLGLMHIEAKDYLLNLEKENYPDIIYIDPMHPERQKSALVKKDMQALQLLFGEDKDAADLINVAIGKAKKRVVVKWPGKVSPLVKPKHTIQGSTVRFDLY